MNIVLNIVLLVLSLMWFSSRQQAATRKSTFPVMLAFVSGNVLVFLLSLAIQMEYLDGFIYLVAAGVNLFIFWLWTSIAIIRHHIMMKTTSNIASDLIQNSIPLIIMLILSLWLSSAQLKIGG
jgi:hypothetical protein